MNILILFAVVSVILYGVAPIGYSYEFSIWCLVVYLFSSLRLLINNCKSNLLKFEFFFLIAIFFSNFVYAVVYYQISPYFSLFNLEFNENYISKGLAISTVGVCFFNLGVYDKSKQVVDKRVLVDIFFRKPNYLLYILSFIFIPYLFTLYLQDTYTTEFESSLVNVVLVYLVYYTIFVVFSNNRDVNSPIALGKNVLRKYPALFIIIIIYTMLFLAIGSRTIPMRIALLSLFLYSIYIHKIKKIAVFYILLVGLLLMTFVGAVRNGGAFDMSALTSIWDLGKDLTINNRSLYVLMEYADMHGYNFGKTMLMNILSMIPFLQSAYLFITGDSISSISSANLVTELFFSDKITDKTFGLGTNVLGDIYVSFGFIGVVLFMYLLGHILKVLYSMICRGDNRAVLIYALLFMDVAYLPRSAFFTSLRSVVWVLFIYEICRRVHLCIGKSVSVK